MAFNKKEYNILHLLATQPLRKYCFPEGLIALILTMCLCYLQFAYGELTLRISLVKDYLSLSGVLLGLIFAIMVLLINILADKQYAILLSETKSGLLPFLTPYFICVVILVTAFIIEILYQAIAPIFIKIEPVLFSLATYVFFYALVDLVFLARITIIHTMTRTELFLLGSNPAEDCIKDETNLEN